MRSEHSSLHFPSVWSTSAVDHERDSARYLCYCTMASWGNKPLLPICRSRFFVCFNYMQFFSKSRHSGNKALLVVSASVYFLYELSEHFAMWWLVLWYWCWVKGCLFVVPCIGIWTRTFSYLADRGGLV